MDAAFFQPDILRLLAARRCEHAITVGYWSWLPLKRGACRRAPNSFRGDRAGDVGRVGGSRPTSPAGGAWRWPPSTIQRLLRRHGLGTRRERLLVLEHHSAQRAGPLTERTRQRLWRARHGSARHVAAQAPGELVCLDTFYIGKLKGVGKVWQITACDAATSYGVAGILPTLAHEAVARFLRITLVPLFQRAGWPIRRVLTDRGNEFKASFDEACRELGIRHTRTKPRHAWTNGFVELLRQTILNEHWRVVFRRQYFTGRAALHQKL